jgi:NAD(P)-dependent dehydrogenase (short-subunit alcohol dehydrogenase family)
MGQLDGRRILVTGAATGIGAAAVQVFLREGARVAAVFHRTDPPAALRDACAWFRADLRVREEVVRTTDAAAAALGGLDVLLHSAGLWAPATPTELSESDLDFLLATNLKSTVFANPAAHAHRKAKGGAILNLGSSEGVIGNPLAAAYSLTKAAVHGWTRAAARAWAPQRVTVNALAPAVETPGADRLRAHLGPAAAKMIDEQIARSIPIGGKLGDPARDLGPALVFLATPGAHFITGQLLAVDGGLLMLGA